MKRMFLLLTGICFALTLTAQTDTTGKSNQSDTIRIGGMIIVNKKGKRGESGDDVEVYRRKRDYKPSNVSTNWFIVDLGFANWTDKTDYAAARTSGFVAPDIDEDQLDLRSGKSVNVNIWIFMQKLNLIKHVVNLKYGFGLELNNYRFSEDIKFMKNPTMIMKDIVKHDKNKLAADYATIPIMLNFNFTPKREEGFGFSVGASGGYLYSARQKFKGGEGKKEKEHDDFDLRKFKVSYIAELQLGPIKFYGSVANQSMWEKALDMTPYNVGVRFSNW
ncbi:MAG TPA: outer membrane beta-barrel protein [Chitinophagaceae bacterium]|nr:outer membrane beta-barrel protein [Chitinophagaceae bacterium]